MHLIQPNPKDLQSEIISRCFILLRQTLITDHDSLFVDIVRDLIQKVKLFGCYFATLDIRQDSRILRKYLIIATRQAQIKSGISQGL